MKTENQKNVEEKIKELFNSLPSAIDPCSLCDGKVGSESFWNAERCQTCCYWYPSKFAPKK